jgi:hypothetical protein
MWIRDEDLEMRIIALCVAILMGAAMSPAQEVVIEPYEVRHAIIAAKNLIETFREKQNLDPALKIDSMVVIDATRNGFGQGDLLVVYPSGEIFPLMTVEEPLRSIMDSWSYREDQQATTPEISSSNCLKKAKEMDSPYIGLLGFILRGLDIYYPEGNYIQGFFRKDPETAFIELWGHDKDKFKYREADESGLGETIEAFDLLQIIRSDTVYIADSTLFDAIYIYKSTSDTVYMPVQESGRR